MSPDEVVERAYAAVTVYLARDDSGAIVTAAEIQSDDASTNVQLLALTQEAVSQALMREAEAAGLTMRFGVKA